MNIAEQFFPSGYAKNAYRIDYRDLYARGYRGLIFDIDNTLVGDNAPADRHAAKLIRQLKMLGFRVMIVSNNNEERVSTFAKALGAGYVYKAQKPSVKGYLEAARKMGCRRDRVMVIGDQLFTDIWGANRSGMHSVLVGRIDLRERPHIYLKRILEAPLLLAFFLRQWTGSFQRREGIS